MSTVKWHYDASPNVGNVDKVARYLIGATLIAAIFIVSEPADWIYLLPLIAIPVVISAITGWDPIYALFQKRPTSERSPLDPKPSSVNEAATAKNAKPNSVDRMPA